MPYKDPIKEKENRAKYYHDHKEELKEYNKEYRKRNKEKIRELKKRYRETHKQQIKDYDKKWKEKNGKIYHAKYMIEYSKKPNEIIKKRIRRMSQYYYGKVSQGFERHHLDYDSPHNFILVSIKEHKEIHIHGVYQP